MTKKELIKSLRAIEEQIADLRDDQDLIKCKDGDSYCICTVFDAARDAVDDIIEKFRWLKEKTK